MSANDDSANPVTNTDADRGQVSRSAAEIYEEFFVPALFAQWAGRVVEAAGLQESEWVLDVACGTGVLARAVAERVGAQRVVGLDANEGMLAVARRTAPGIDWRLGSAEALPFDDASFDAVVSQFGLMFFADRRAALQEMWRALRPGGRLVVAVWDSIEHSPGYAALADLLQELFGDEAADALRAPFALGDVQKLRALYEVLGAAPVEISTQPGTARFPSIAAWIHTEIKGWVLANRLDDTQFAALLAAAEQRLATFRTPDGEVVFAAPAHIVSATKE
ncbi:MAG TPA: methyltransferase domain-containing protein [Ktedonobacterales bacterium]|jgi:ubiquinone/menaquinone biosynthesis C-methylase UbiE